MMMEADDNCFDNDNGEHQFREELKNISFEDLQKLKNKLGTKIYNDTVLGKNKAHSFKICKARDLTRKTDKDRPLEVSAKKRVSRLMQVMPVKKPVIRDPRFDRLCGEFNEKAFKKDYSFLNDVKRNDLKRLKKELNSAEDPETIKKIKYLIQRLENQLREADKRNKRDEKEKAEKKETVETRKKGEKPRFIKKSEKKILELVQQYEELKNSGKLKKHIQRLRKKNTCKDRKKMMKSNITTD